MDCEFASCSSNMLETVWFDLLKSRKFSDVSFIVGGTKEEIFAHKLVLMARSNVFETMFLRWETGEKPQVKISDVSASTFKTFLRFLYTNNLALDTVNEATEILFVARKYDIKLLEEKCSAWLMTQISSKNVICIRESAVVFDLKDLETKAMDFIFKNGRAVLTSPGFLDVSRDVLSNILQRDDFDINELTAFTALMRWAENQCQLNQVENTNANKRHVLGNLIHLIRFPLMSMQVFEDEVVAKYDGILTEDEVLGLKVYFALADGTSFEEIQPEPILPFSKKARKKNMWTVMPYSQLLPFGSSSKPCRLYDLPDFHIDARTNIRQTNIEFTSSKDIWIKDIEFYPFYENEFFRACKYIHVSKINVSLTIELIPGKNGYVRVGASQLTVGNPRLPFSAKFDDNGGLQILKDRQYLLKICIIMEKGNFDQRMLPLADNRDTPAPIEVSCGEERIEFSFKTRSDCEDCFLVVNGLGGARHCQCVCNALIKAIHFNI